MANKKLKVLLTQCAISAILVDPELNDKYYQKRKEGKPHMLALNIIRAKLIYRIWAVVKRGTKFTPAAGVIVKPADMELGKTRKVATKVKAATGVKTTMKLKPVATTNTPRKKAKVT